MYCIHRYDELGEPSNTRSKSLVDDGVLLCMSAVRSISICFFFFFRFFLPDCSSSSVSLSSEGPVSSPPSCGISPDHWKPPCILSTRADRPLLGMVIASTFFRLRV